MSIPTGTPHTLEEHRQFYDDTLSLLVTKLTDSAKIGDTIKTQFYAECIEYLSTFIRDGNPVFPLYLQRHEKTQSNTTVNVTNNDTTRRSTQLTRIITTNTWIANVKCADTKINFQVRESYKFNTNDLTEIRLVLILEQFMEHQSNFSVQFETYLDPEKVDENTNIPFQQLKGDRPTLAMLLDMADCATPGPVNIRQMGCQIPNLGMNMTFTRGNPNMIMLATTAVNLYIGMVFHDILPEISMGIFNTIITIKRDYLEKLYAENRNTNDGLPYVNEYID